MATEARAMSAATFGVKRIELIVSLAPLICRYRSLPAGYALLPSASTEA